MGRCTTVTDITMTTIRILHFVAFLPPRPSPDPALVHYAFYVQVSHITAWRVFVFVEGGGEEAWQA